jgi:hypothetical protein
MVKLKYFARKVTNQNLIYEGITRGLNFGNACYHTIQNFCPSACYVRM